MAMKFVLTFSFCMLFQICFAQGTWEQKADYPDNVMGAFGFAIDSLGYLGMGWNPGPTFEMYAFNPTTGQWIPRANYPGTFVGHSVSVACNGKGYVSTGIVGSGVTSNELWEYDPITDSWTEKTNLPGSTRTEAVAFSIDDKIYIGAGSNLNTALNDFWEYDTTNDTWTQIADFPSNRISAEAFSINGKGYVGIGYDPPTLKTDFWEYDPTMNTWTPVADFPGIPRGRTISFILHNEAYIGAGWTGSSGNLKDLWKYNPITDSWEQMADIGDKDRGFGVGFSINGKGYVGTGGNQGVPWYNDFWEYTPDMSTAIESDIDIDHAKIFPNPSSQKVYVQFKDSQNKTILLLNALGQQVKAVRNNQTDLVELNIESLSNGIYFLLVKKEDTLLHTQKLIINHQ